MERIPQAVYTKEFRAEAVALQTANRRRRGSRQTMVGDRDGASGALDRRPEFKVVVGCCRPGIAPYLPSQTGWLKRLRISSGIGTIFSRL